MHSRWLLEYDDPHAIVEEILRLRRRGLGARRIAKLVFGNRISLDAATKRIQRLLSRIGAKFSPRQSADLDIFGQKPEKSAPLSEKVTSSEPRLGPTERLIYDALNILEEATPSMIKAYLEEQGLTKSLRSIYSALWRLERRGIAWRTRRGFYALATGLYYHDLLAENVHVSELPVPLHSKKERGHAAMFSSVVAMAEQLNATSTERIELWMPVPDKRLREWALRLRRLGWRLVKIYYNTYENALKVEAAYYNPAYPLRTAYRSEWLKLYVETLMMGSQAITSILRRLGAVGQSVQGTGWRGVSKLGSGSGSSAVGGCVGGVGFA